MITVEISKTFRTYQKGSRYQKYDVQSYDFPDLDTAKQWVAQQYPQCKRYAPIYQDGPDGKPIRVGRLYGFQGYRIECRRSTCGKDPAGHWHETHEQHWVTFYRKEPIENP